MRTCIKALGSSKFGQIGLPRTELSSLESLKKYPLTYYGENGVVTFSQLFSIGSFSYLVYKFKKIRGMTDFPDQFRKIIMRYKRIGYNLNVMQQSACLVINPITVDGYAALFNCTPVDRASDSMMARPKAIHFSWLGPELFVCCLVHRGSTDYLLLLQIFSGVV